MRVPCGMALVVAGVVAAAAPAQAHLRGGVATVEADRAHMGAVAASARAASHTRHTLTMGVAGQVREYSNAAGQVFALSWETAGRPDLRQLLGTDLFATYQAGIEAAGPRRGRMPTAGQGASGDLVVRSFGHPGAFSGFAYVPSLIPPGFSALDMQ